MSERPDRDLEKLARGAKELSERHIVLHGKLLDQMEHWVDAGTLRSEALGQYLLNNAKSASELMSKTFAIAANRPVVHEVRHLMDVEASLKRIPGLVVEGTAEEMPELQSPDGPPPEEDGPPE